MKLLLIGCGNIGKILLASWLKSEAYEQIVVIEPSLSEEHTFADKNLTFLATPQEISENFKPDAVIICVKPQVLTQVLPRYQRFTETSLFVSVAAGTPIEFLQQQLGKTVNSIRVMPNVAMQVAASTNLAFAPDSSVDAHKNIVTQLFTPTGRVLWLNEESQLETLTPISGSGPAYFFLLAQLLIDTAIECGIDADIASKAVRQTLLGSALLAQEHDDLLTLKQSVTSKGGTTEAALKVLEEKLPELLTQAINTALDRQKVLAS